jgi:signal transduction histidine kinase
VLFPPALLLTGLPVGALERRRLVLLKRAPAGNPHATAPPGLIAWLRCRLGEGSTWREFAYTVCLLPVLAVDLVGVFALFICLLFLALPLLMSLDSFSVRLRLGSLFIDSVGKAWIASAAVGLPATIIAIYALCVLAGVQGAFTRWLLMPSGAELAQRLEELTASRTRLVNAFEAERRRIERDLHDGAQQHLVLLAMNLGLAELELGDGDRRAGELVGEAHQQARLALAAIRAQIHGIHPQVLTDFGLSAAVGELAERCPIPVHLDMDVAHRLPSPVESTAYFFVSEALANVARHAQAHHVTVRARLVDDHLLLAVIDDGRGGADPSRGSGLRGLADRAAVIDGTLKVTSPEGGPTTLRMELPCRFE